VRFKSIGDLEGGRSALVRAKWAYKNRKTREHYVYGFSIKVHL